MPLMVSATDLQRNSAGIIKRAKASGKPIVVVRNNKPEVAVIDIKKLEELIKKARDWEEKDALEAIKEGEEEFQAGKTLLLSDDMHELLDD